MYCLYGGFKYQDVIHDHYKTCRAEFKAYKGINTDIFSSFPTHIFRTLVVIRNDTGKPSFQILFRKKIFTLIPSLPISIL